MGRQRDKANLLHLRSNLAHENGCGFDNGWYYDGKLNGLKVCGCKKYIGARKGMVCKRRTAGLGYYRDGAEPACDDPVIASCVPIQLLLNNLVPKRAPSVICRRRPQQTRILS